MVTFQYVNDVLVIEEDHPFAEEPVWLPDRFDSVVIHHPEGRVLIATPAKRHAERLFGPGGLPGLCRELELQRLGQNWQSNGIWIISGVDKVLTRKDGEAIAHYVAYRISLAANSMPAESDPKPNPGLIPFPSIKTTKGKLSGVHSKQPIRTGKKNKREKRRTAAGGRR